MGSSLPAWLTDHCQFGKHGEPFLWYGSGSDLVDIAIMKLINLVQDDPEMAYEAVEFIDACVADSVKNTTCGGALKILLKYGD
ncbi:MAG: hypothetical protein WA061_02725 [Microgenomates group bacterium]